jgi:hypothetical protein
MVRKVLVRRGTRKKNDKEIAWFGFASNFLLGYHSTFSFPLLPKLLDSHQATPWTKLTGDKIGPLFFFHTNH